ncbi:hypothetical protein RJJ65_32320 [Rhizobium hidalgonense]|uniref:Uncharacterized protein n=1 Tax=Rhizobium hidalgonense TaxID=1538159 RepID=A0AAJ2GWK3_9HYPH|nr:hypothetical protein [Rhizobium hidalgonense]MDR9777245.1 hypothetical protein [Rhizobium hidalgonense]
MTDTKSRLDAINAKILTENARLHDGLGKAIVVVWMAAAVFFGFALAEPRFKAIDLDRQEVTSWK